MKYERWNTPLGFKGFDKSNYMRTINRIMRREINLCKQMSLCLLLYNQIYASLHKSTLLRHEFKDLRGLRTDQLQNLKNTHSNKIHILQGINIHLRPLHSTNSRISFYYQDLGLCQNIRLMLFFQIPQTWLQSLSQF